MRTLAATMQSAAALTVPAWLTVRVGRRLAAAWLVVALAVTMTGLGLMALEPALDHTVADVMAQHRADWSVNLATLLVLFTQSYVIFPLILVFGLLAARDTGDLDALWVPALAVGGGFAVSIVVKVVVARPRPSSSLAAVEAFGPAFPSGHSIRAAAVAGAIAWLVSRRVARRAVAISGLALLLPVAVAASRVYQGAHWLTDVVVGVMVGAIWVAIIVRVAGRRSAEAEPSDGLGHARGGPDPPSPPPSLTSEGHDQQ